jgi:hypothetical protein
MILAPGGGQESFNWITLPGQYKNPPQQSWQAGG